MSRPSRDAAKARTLSEEDLGKELEESRRSLFTLRLQAATHQLANHREIRKARKRVARLLTLRREREGAAAYAALGAGAPGEARE